MTETFNQLFLTFRGSYPIKKYKSFMVFVLEVDAKCSKPFCDTELRPASVRFEDMIEGTLQ